jgi:hypothetical protein
MITVLGEFLRRSCKLQLDTNSVFLGGELHNFPWGMAGVLIWHDPRATQRRDRSTRSAHGPAGERPSVRASLPSPMEHTGH